MSWVIGQGPDGEDDFSHEAMQRDAAAVEEIMQQRDDDYWADRADAEDGSTSLFTLASIVEQSGSETYKEIRERYKELALLGSEGIIGHELNQNGVGYLNHIYGIVGHTPDGVAGVMQGPVYGFFRNRAFGEGRYPEEPGPSLTGLLVTYALVKPLRGIRHASVDAAVEYLTQNPSTLESLRELAEAHAETDSRAVAFLRDTTPERLEEQRAEIENHGGLVYRMARMYQKAVNGR